MSRERGNPMILKEQDAWRLEDSGSPMKHHSRVSGSRPRKNFQGLGLAALLLGISACASTSPREPDSLGPARSSRAADGALIDASFSKLSLAERPRTGGESHRVTLSEGERPIPVGSELSLRWREDELGRRRWRIGPVELAFAAEPDGLRLKELVIEADEPYRVITNTLLKPRGPSLPFEHQAEGLFLFEREGPAGAERLGRGDLELSLESLEIQELPKSGDCASLGLALALSFEEAVEIRADQPKVGGLQMGLRLWHDGSAVQLLSLRVTASRAGIRVVLFDLQSRRADNGGS